MIEVNGKSVDFVENETVKELLKRIKEINCKIFGLNYELKEIQKRIVQIENEKAGQTSLLDQIK